MERSRKVRAVFLSSLLSTAVAPASAEAVTESQAIRLFLEQSPQARRVDSIERASDAALRSEARVADPELAYQVEEAADVRDEFLTLRQELPITGRRALLVERAAAASTAAGLAARARTTSCAPFRSRSRPFATRRRSGASRRR